MARNLFRRVRIAAPPTSSASRLSYLPGLDGLRALAVLAVLLYHADLQWLPGGFLGVEIFFVVSGYLITSLLLAEYRAHNRISLKKFWQRRARRLLPALFGLLVAVLVYAVFFLPDEVAGLRADVLAALTYVTNWYLIVAQKSYFQEIGRPSLLRHLWSLAVEEQFYLLWPLIFALVLTRLKTRAALLLLMLGAAVSALWMGLQYQPDTDPSRIYYGTDTRAAGLLLGAALAFVLPRAKNSTSRFSLGKPALERWLLDGVGFAALGGLIAACLLLGEFEPFLYQGGMLLVGAATALVIAAVVSPQSPLLAPLLGFGVLRWIGLRSYSLYLWHWPVFMVTRPQLDTTLEGAPLLLVRLSATFLLAELSFRLIESPFRNGSLGRAWNASTTARGARRWALASGWAALVATMVIGGLLLANVLIQAQPAQEPELILSIPEEENVVPPANDMPALTTVLAVSPGEANEIAPADDEQVSDIVTSSSLASVSFLLGASVGSVEFEQPLTNDAHSARWGADHDDTWESPVEASPGGAAAHQVEADLAAARSFESPKLVRQPPAPFCEYACRLRQELYEYKEGFVRFAPVPPRPTVAPPLTKPLVLPMTAALPRQARLPQIDAPANIQPPPQNARILAIGDSVMLGASLYLRKYAGATEVDAKVGRQVSAALQILRARQSANLLPTVVIVHLGNNGTFSSRQFDEMMSVLRDVPRVIFLTNKVPRPWQVSNNNALFQGDSRYPNAILVDWYSVSAQHPEWFWNDGIHLRPEGAQVYANLIASQVAPVQ